MCISLIVSSLAQTKNTKKMETLSTTIKEGLEHGKINQKTADNLNALYETVEFVNVVEMGIDDLFDIYGPEDYKCMIADLLSTVVNNKDVKKQIGNELPSYTRMLTTMFTFFADLDNSDDFIKLREIRDICSFSSDSDLQSKLEHSERLLERYNGEQSETV